MQLHALKEAAEVRPARAEGRLRLRGALVAIPCVGVLAAAWSLRARHAGFGTHEELGLPPCSFLARTGYPCPSCGLTTAFAAMAHGHVAAALEAQPFGVLLFVAAVAVGCAAAAEAVTGRDFLRLLRPGIWWAVVAAGGLLAGWGCKVAVGVAQGTLPLR